MFKLTCIQCKKKFQSPVSRSKFCSPDCRIKYFRLQKRKGEEITKLAVKGVRTEKKEVVTVKSSFTPNWKRNGFKSKEEAMAHVIECLFENRKKLIDASVSGEAVFTYQNHIIRIEGKRKKKK